MYVHVPVILPFSDTNLSNYGNNICKKNPGGYLFSYLWFSAQTNWVIDLYLFSTLSAFYTHVYCEVFSKYSLLNVQSYSVIHLF